MEIEHKKHTLAMDEQLILPEDPRAKYIKVSYKGVEIFCTGIIIKGNMCEWEN